MKLIFSDKREHDALIEPKMDGSVDITLRAQNGTGSYTVILSRSDFDTICKVRELVMDKED